MCKGTQYFHFWKKKILGIEKVYTTFSIIKKMFSKMDRLRHTLTGLIKKMKER